MPALQKKHKKSSVHNIKSVMNTRYGLGERIRTSGLLNPIQARYQTALHPGVVNERYYTTQERVCQWGKIQKYGTPGGSVGGIDEFQEGLAIGGEIHLRQGAAGIGKGAVRG